MMAPVITVGTSPFVPDRTVVYWHHATTEGGPGPAILKANYCGAFLHVGHQDIPQAWIVEAKRVAQILAADPGADLSHLSQGA
jgi:hypothetical protein